MSGAALQLVLSLAGILLGALLTFVEGLDVRTLCYVFCVLLVAAGVAAIAYFFLSGAYKRLDDYNFALGVMLLILGCCGFARIESMEGSFLAYMGFLVLATGIVALQNTVQLRVVGSGAWPVGLLFTAVILFGGITILLDIRVIWDAVQYWILIVSGVLGLAGLILTAFALRKAAKQEGMPPNPVLVEPNMPEMEKPPALPHGYAADRRSDAGSAENSG